MKQIIESQKKVMNANTKNFTESFTFLFFLVWPFVPELVSVFLRNKMILSLNEWYVVVILPELILLIWYFLKHKL
jgi:hypothetical protein